MSKRITGVAYENGKVIGVTIDGLNDGTDKAYFKRELHGVWEWFDEETGTPFTGYEREWGWRCSYCGEELPDNYDDPDDIPTFRFCYNCGAKMDGGDGDAAD